MTLTYGTNDTDKKNATYTGTDEFSWGRASSDLPNLVYTPARLICLDRDGWTPNGNFHKPLDTILDSDIIGYWANEMSNNDTILTTPPTLNVVLRIPKDLPSIILNFSENPCTEFSIVTRDESNNIVDSVNVVNNHSLEYSLDLSGAYIKSVSLTFNKMEQKEQFFKLGSVYIGDLVAFSDRVITGVTSEFISNPYAITLDISTLDFKMIQESDVLFTDDMLIRCSDGDRFFGAFFLKSYKKTGVREWTVKTESMLGVLDTFEFLGGMYVNALFGDLINEIAEGSELTFDIQDGLENYYVNGWIPICTKREALQQLCFSVGATVVDIYSQNIQIKRTFYAHPDKITDSILFTNPEIETEKTVTGVELDYYDFQTTTEKTVIYSGNMLGNDVIIKFDNPMYGFNIVQGTILESGANFIRVNGGVSITGYEYKKVQHKAKLYLQTNESDANIKSISSVYLVTPNNYFELLQMLYTLYASVTKITADMIAQQYELTQIPKINTYLGEKCGILSDVVYNFGKQFHKASIELDFCGVDPHIPDLPHA